MWTGRAPIARPTDRNMVEIDLADALRDLVIDLACRMSDGYAALLEDVKDIYRAIPDAESTAEEFELGEKLHLALDEVMEPLMQDGVTTLRLAPHIAAAFAANVKFASNCARRPVA